MIIKTTPQNWETMRGPFIRRRRQRRAEKRAQAREIEEQTSRLVDAAYDGYNVNQVVYGADISTGTHEGDPELARMRLAAAQGGGVPMWPLLVGGGLVLVLVMRGKKQ